MIKKDGFTLIELLVVIAIIALLLSILSPSLQKAKQNALGVVCRSNLHQWYLCLGMYTKENNEKIWQGWNPVNYEKNFWWLEAMQPYYADVGKIRCCPAATKPEWIDATAGVEGPGFDKQPFMAWGHMDWLDPHDVFEEDPWGSYAVNGWLEDRWQESTDYYNSDPTKFWRSMTAIKALGTVPFMTDAQWIGTHPEPDDVPPKTEDAHWQNQQTSHFVRIIQNRHGRGQQNCVFMDGTARKVGLKEMWTFKWHKGYDTRGPWTLAGGATRDKWADPDKGAPWMVGFKDY